jgi:prepilin-type processing-associated H-X9-DG protein
MLSPANGPFRPPVVTPDYTSHSSYAKPQAYGITSWSSRDSVAWWSDGTSNQIIFGEEYIPLTGVGACSVANGHWDCSYMGASGNAHTVVVARGFRFGTLGSSGGWIPISRPSDDDVKTQNIRAWSFGSWHPGVCNFLLGDGSVRGISVTTPVENILYPLSHTNDGAAVHLP